MNDLQRGVLLLVKSAITGEKYALPEGFDFAQACADVKHHHMVMLLYEGAINCGIPQSDPAMRQLFQGYCKALLYSEGQQQELERLFQAFDQNSIDYLPLKGCIMKQLYPRPELRTMGDADILIRMEQYSRISPVMVELGYTAGKESQHELVWDTPKLQVELHKCLISPNERMAKRLWVYLEDTWNKATAVSATRYELSDEETFLFLFIHFVKHYAIYGIGCRHVVDLWVYLRTHPALDHAYIEETVAGLDLLAFYRNTRKLIRAWFEEGPSDDAVDAMHDFIFSCGSFGSKNNAVVARHIRNERYGHMSNKTQFLVTRLFPKKEAIQSEYPALKKAPWLLPAIWVIRPIRKMFGQKQFLRRSLRLFSQINEETIDEHDRMFRTVGLNQHYYRDDH